MTEFECPINRAALSPRQLGDCGNMCVRACVVKETLAENIPGITITGEGLVVAEHPKDIAFSRDNDRRPIETGEVATYVDSVIAK